jgi:hypothetical protein
VLKGLNSLYLILLILKRIPCIIFVEKVRKRLMLYASWTL